MNRQKYIAEIENRLGILGVNIAKSDDENILVFNGLFNRVESEEGVLYFLSLKINVDNNSVFATQKVSYNQQMINDSELQKLKLVDKDGKTFIASDILQIVRKITKANGFRFVKTEHWLKEENDFLTANAPFVQIVYDDNLQKPKRSKMKYIVVFSLITLIVALIIILVTRNNPVI